jgi:hypothetical protein
MCYEVTVTAFMLPSMGQQDRNSVQVTAKASAALGKLQSETDLPKKVLVERVFVWLIDQPEEVRALVLGLVPKAIAPDVARVVLERMAQNSRKVG